jgi:hypothetical protein
MSGRLGTHRAVSGPITPPSSSRRRPGPNSPGHGPPTAGKAVQLLELFAAVEGWVPACAGTTSSVRISLCSSAGL